MTRRELLALGASLGISPLAFAQQRVETSDEEVVIKGGVELVNILATVRGKNNALIKNLQASDFKILDDGKQQPIRDVASETQLPLMLGMLIDLSGSMSVQIPDEKSAGARFFRQVLRPKDRAFVAVFRTGIEMLQDVTSKPEELEAGLNRIVYDREQAGWTNLYDAVYLACEQRLSGQQERRVLIVLSDGQDYGSRMKLNDAIKAAQTAEVMIYTIAYLPTQDTTISRPAPSGTPAGTKAPMGPNVMGDSAEDVMAKLAEATGGRMYRVYKATTLDKIYAEIGDEVRSQYSISFSPSTTLHDGKFHKLEVRAGNKDYKVSARKGYYANSAK